MPELDTLNYKAMWYILEKAINEMLRKIEIDDLKDPKEPNKSLTSEQLFRRVKHHILFEIILDIFHSIKKDDFSRIEARVFDMINYCPDNYRNPKESK
jgi:hypothetical protein